MQQYSLADLDLLGSVSEECLLLSSLCIHFFSCSFFDLNSQLLISESHFPLSNQYVSAYLLGSSHEWCFYDLYYVFISFHVRPLIWTRKFHPTNVTYSWTTVTVDARKLQFILTSCFVPFQFPLQKWPCVVQLVSVMTTSFQLFFYLHLFYSFNPPTRALQDPLLPSFLFWMTTKTLMRMMKKKAKTAASKTEKQAMFLFARKSFRVTFSNSKRPHLRR